MGIMSCCNGTQDELYSVPVKTVEVTEVHVADRVDGLKQRAMRRFGVKPEKCHVGHIVFQAMAENPEGINQVRHYPSIDHYHECLCYYHIT